MTRAIAASAALAVGCGVDDSGGGPAGVGSSSGTTPAAGCQAGEAQQADGSCLVAGVDVCADGFAPEGLGGCRAILPEAACLPGQIAVPGDMACREIAPCGEGSWGGIPVEADTEFVDGAYSGASDGGPEAPWTTIADALSAAARGAIVAVAAGTYQESLVISGSPVRLWGRCPALVEIVGQSGPPSAILVAKGAAGTVIRGVTVSGPGYGIGVTGSEGVSIERVRIHATVQHVAVNDLYGTTAVTITDSLLESAAGIGLLVRGDATATVERSVVRGTTPGGGGFGEGLIVDNTPGTHDRGRLIVRASLIDGNQWAGVMVLGADAEIESTVVRGTTSGPGSSTTGSGVAAQDDEQTGERAAVTLRGSSIEGNMITGITLSGTDATIERTVVEGTLGGSDIPSLGRGVNAEDHGASGARCVVTMRSSLLQGNRDAALFIAGSDATVESVRIRGTLPQDSSQGSGRGVEITKNPLTGSRANVTITASVVEDNFDIGVGVFASDAVVDRSVVAGTRARAVDGLFGDGLLVVSLGDAASAIARSSRLAANARAGIAVFGATVTVQGSELECNGVHVDGESYDGREYLLEDGGGSTCGCDAVPVTCQVVSSSLTPPEPLPTK